MVESIKVSVPLPSVVGKVPGGAVYMNGARFWPNSEPNAPGAKVPAPKDAPFTRVKATGVTAFEIVAAGPWPAALIAATVHVYEVRLVRPVTVMGLDAAFTVSAPGLQVTT
jgi:hypothetical protein